MNGARAHAERQPWLVGLSVALYQTLLLLYPTRFRRAYGAQMAQVFRDSCRDVIQQGGAGDVAHLWLVTLGDLVVTALAEHADQGQEITSMEHRSLSRAAGLAGLSGGALLLLYGATELLYSAALWSGADAFANLLFQPRYPGLPWLPWALAMSVPLAWVCVIIAIWGLAAHGARRGGAGVFIGATIALVGASLGLIGGVSFVLGRWGSWYTAPDLGISHFDQLSGSQLPYLGALDLFGRMVVGLGLVTMAVALLARRGAIAKRVQWLTLALGVTALLPYLYVYLATPGAILASLPAGTLYGGRLPYTPFTLPFPATSSANLLLVFALLEAGFALVWGVCWLALGRYLWRQPDDGALATSPTPQLGLSV